jgi:hypothetical protein
MNILVINHSVENCGVYQYGKRVGHILKKSKKYKFIYLEQNSQEELDQNIEIYKPKIIIYNYLGGTMPWVNPYTVANIRSKNIKQFLIVHNGGYAQFFDYYLHQDPYYNSSDNINFALMRPLFDYKPKTAKHNTNIIKIGSFGFGLRCKYIHDICNIVKQQMSNKNVEINLHLTNAHFSNGNDINGIKTDCLNILSGTNIKLNVTTDFLSDKQILDFLYNNNLNIFFYEKYNFYNGISSTIDYALSVKKPLAICQSNMFSHIWDVTPSICVENNSLENIINNKFTPLLEKATSWNNKNFITHMESIIEKVLNV